MAVEATTPDVGRVYEVIGQRIRELRERRGLTQDELAVRTGISRASVTQSESGHQRLPLQSLYMVAAALGAAIADLLPTVAELSPGDQDIFRRLSSDQRLNVTERDALTDFFGRLISEGKGK